MGLSLHLPAWYDGPTHSTITGGIVGDTNYDLLISNLDQLLSEQAREVSGSGTKSGVAEYEVEVVSEGSSEPGDTRVYGLALRDGTPVSVTVNVTP